MTTNSTLIQNLTPEEIRQIIREELQALQPKDTTPKYFSRDEVCNLFKISLPTLNVYTKKGIIKGVKLGSRVLYPEENVKSALQDATILKYRRS